MLSFAGNPEQAQKGLKRIRVSSYAFLAEMTDRVQRALYGPPICLRQTVPPRIPLSPMLIRIDDGMTALFIVFST